MSRLGICCSHRIAWPNVANLTRLGFPLVRTVVYELDAFERAVAALQGASRVIALVEGQTEMVGDLNSLGWEARAATAAERVASIEGVDYVSMFNELDLWNIPVEMAIQAAVWMAPRIAAKGKRPILTSVVSGGWQDYVQRLADGLPSEIRGLVWADTHPYGRRAQGFPSWFGWGAEGWEAECAYALTRVYDLTGLPCVATESGIKLADANHDNNEVADIGDEQAQATFVGNWCRSFLGLRSDLYPFACYFAWNDAVGQAGEQGEYAFGLVREDLSERLSLRAYSEAMSVPVPPVQYSIGGGLAAAIRDKGWTPQSDEIYGLSYVKCEEGPIFWLPSEGARWAKWRYLRG